VIVTLLTTTVYLFQNHHPVDGRIIGLNMLIKILQIKTLHQIKVHVFLLIHFINRIIARNVEHTKMFYNSSNRGQCRVKLTERTNNREVRAEISSQSVVTFKACWAVDVPSAVTLKSLHFPTHCIYAFSTIRTEGRLV